MKKAVQIFKNNWLFIPDRRQEVFALLSAGLAFLIPVFGWSPLLILWAVNSCLCYREMKHSKLRFVHAALALLFLTLIVINLCLSIFLFLQCFGFIAA